MRGPPCSSASACAAYSRGLAPWGSTPAQVVRIMVLCAALVQLLSLVYTPGRYIPGADILNARRSFERQLASLPGDVFVINHSYDAIMAGKPPHAVIDAFGIIQDGHPSPLRSAYLDDMHRAIDNHVYSAIVLDDTAATHHPGAGWMPADFEAQYPVRILASSGPAYQSGGSPEPEETWIYLPCAALNQDTSAFITPDAVVSYDPAPLRNHADEWLDAPSPSLFTMASAAFTDGVNGWTAERFCRR